VEREERELIEELVRDNLASADRDRGHAKRGQHPKHHGCVRAVFSVADYVPADLKSGIFGRPQDFEALIRFSNGRVDDDRNRDAHGMAIKVLNVPGTKLVAGHENETAHDFILVDSEVFFTGDLQEYVLFTRDFLAARRNILRTSLFLARMLVFHRGLLLKARKFANQTPSSPLASWYFSSVPYRLGGRIVKYVARPRLSGTPRGPVATEDGLSRALVEHLAAAEAVFDFGVDVHTVPSSQPIDDPSVCWSAQAGARREWLATITIPRQEVDPRSPLAENLSYSPWHALKEHEPVGAINRARMPVYEQMARLRHEMNGIVPAGTSEIPSCPFQKSNPDVTMV
jgi:hypothetical protein